MTELTFTKDGDVYVCEATVNADFNLHIERLDYKPITVEMTTVEGTEYKNILNDRAELIDEDFDAIVYPKYIRIRSWSAIKKAFLTEAE